MKEKKNKERNEQKEKKDKQTKKTKRNEKKTVFFKWKKWKSKKMKKIWKMEKKINLCLHSLELPCEKHPSGDGWNEFGRNKRNIRYNQIALVTNEATLRKTVATADVEAVLSHIRIIYNWSWNIHVVGVKKGYSPSQKLHNFVQSTWFCFKVTLFLKVPTFSNSTSKLQWPTADFVCDCQAKDNIRRLSRRVRHKNCIFILWHHFKKHTISFNFV